MVYLNTTTQIQCKIYKHKPQITHIQDTYIHTYRHKKKDNINICKNIYKKERLMNSSATFANS